jgi:peptidoglycan L-alanyl-D-glutamate endopeptidase CwlK
MDDRSEKNLKGVDPNLVSVVQRAYSIVSDNPAGLSFIVTEGLRTIERQKQLLKVGASRTMNSKHIVGKAVDLAAKVGDDIRWDWPLYKRLAEVMKQASKELNVPIVWGGDWKTFKDGPHFELV